MCGQISVGALQQLRLSLQRLHASEAAALSANKSEKSWLIIYSLFVYELLCQSFEITAALIAISLCWSFENYAHCRSPFTSKVILQVEGCV